MIEVLSQVARERSTSADMSSYFDAVQKKDARLHQAALQREYDEDVAMRALQKQEAASVPEKSAAPKHKAVPAKEEAVPAREEAVSTEALANSEGSIFGSAQGNKQGFHAPHIARAAGVRQQLTEASKIARNDLQDCAFTLC